MPVFGIIVKKATPPTPPAPSWSGWTDFTDPENWTVTEGSWDITKWITEFTDPYYDWKVEPLGTGPLDEWWVGAYPTLMRITYSSPGSQVECYMKDTEGGSLVSDPVYNNLEEKTLVYDLSPGGPYDIASLQLRSFPNSNEITKIEFYAPNWVEHWDNSDFDSYYGSWDGSKWPSVEDPYNPGTQIVELDVIGTWYESYRPTKVRITYTGGEATQYMLVSDGGPPVATGDYASGAEIDLTWDVNDLAFIIVSNDNNTPFSITKVEWLED